jgi:ATP-dependent HslUV protease ATP-binding subunit HslU
MKAFTPKEIVAELDRYIIGQGNAKRSVAIALRNRWRRQQLDEVMREEVSPKNILMIGSTGVGKTEIARRLAKIDNAPFVKVEATKFTEVGYVGRDVEQIIRDLVEAAIDIAQDEARKGVKAQADHASEEKILDALVGTDASEETRNTFRIRLRSGQLDEKMVDIEVPDTGGGNPFSSLDLQGGQMQMGMIDMSDIINKAIGGERTKIRKMNVAAAKKLLIQIESDRLLDKETIIETALREAEQNGIVFLDEIDKICSRSQRDGSVSREGVQRDLLPLLEGTLVATKHGSVKTDHILFIASGAFHVAKPSDLLPELQGRLPIRVELEPLKEEDFVKILNEPENSLLKQYKALIETEGVHVEFTEGGVSYLAKLAFNLNQSIENIGARRLHTVMEKLFEDISFDACENCGQTYTINKEYVEETVGKLSKSIDVSKFIL